MVEEVATAVGLDLATTAVAGATKLGRAKADQFLRERAVDRGLDDIDTEFARALEAEIDELADDEAGELAGVTDDWDEIVREIHDLTREQAGDGEATDDRGVDRLPFEDTEDAVDTVAEAIATVHGYDLAETPQLRRELKEALGCAYREAMDDFLGDIADTELGHELALEAQLESAEELRVVREHLSALVERLSTPQHYDLTHVPEDGLDTAAEPIALTGPDLEFVDRPDIEGCYDAHRLLLVGPGGAGKSRALADLVEHYERDVTHVVRPGNAFNDAKDFRRLRDEQFRGDVLLVWDDIHDIAPEQDNTIFRKTVTKLDDTLPEDATLHVLATTRVEGLNSLPGSPRSDEGDSLWSGFETVELEPLTAELIAGIFARALDSLEVDATDEVKEQFLRKALDADPSPLYVTSVVQTAGERLTETDIEEIPDRALDIWQDQYADIYHERVDWADSEQRYVLWSLKILKEIGITPYGPLVRGVYAEALGRNEDEIGPPLATLEEQQWFVERETDDGTVLYEMHDVKAEAVDESVERKLRDMSEFFREKLNLFFPRGVDSFEQTCHGQLALYLESADIRHSLKLAEKHYLEIIGEGGINPEDGMTHYNYAHLLKNELDDPEKAANHYQQAIKFNPELDWAHNNYASLLESELDKPEEAANHYEQAIKLNPELAEAYYNYASLLENELNRPEEAREYYKRASKLNPENRTNSNKANNQSGMSESELPRKSEAYQEGVNNNAERAKAYCERAKNLQDEGRVQEAATHYRRAIELDPELARAHSNYAKLLSNEGRPDEAADHYKRAIEIRPKYPEAYYGYAVQLHELGRHNEAANYYERAVDINPRLAGAHSSYGTVLFSELDRPVDAREHLETSVRLWTEQGILTNALNDLRTLVRVCRALDDGEAAVEHCERAASLLDQLEEDRPDDRAWFDGQQALAEGGEETARLYQSALVSVNASEPALATELFEAVWDRRDEHDEDTTELAYARAAGVALAAHAELFDDTDLPEYAPALPDADVILEALDPNDLHTPENVVYGHLVGDDPGVDAADLREYAEEQQQEGETLLAFECQAFATLLDSIEEDETPIRDRLTWDVDPWTELDADGASVAELYDAALLAVRERDADAMGAFTAAWERRGEVTGDERAAAVAAGVALLAHVEMDMLDASTIDREAVETAVDAEQDRLAEGVLALYDACTGAEPRVGPGELTTDIESEGELSRDEFERLVLAELLGSVVTDVTDLYERALGAIAENEGEDALQALQTAVQLHERTDEADRHPDGAAAAVVLLAHAELGMVDDDTLDREAIAETVDRHESALSRAVLALYDACTGAEPRASPEELRETADRDDPDWEDIETLVLAGLLATVLDDSETDDTGAAESTPASESEQSLSTDGPASASYVAGLEAATDGDWDEAFDEFGTAWTEREAVDEPVEHRAAVTAGIALFAASELGMTDGDTVSRSELVRAVALRREHVTEAAGTLFDVSIGAPSATVQVQEFEPDGATSDADPRTLERQVLTDLLDRLVAATEGGDRDEGER